MTSFNKLESVDRVIRQLTLEDKIDLLAGQGQNRTTGVKRLNIPSLDTSDGPNGLRGYKMFKPVPAFLLPCGTAMGATFDTDMMRKVGNLLAAEAKCRRVSVLLAPVVCLQRSPLLGRGFEAFGEDPFMSGLMGAAYVSGVQEHGIVAAVKHFCAHDQTYMSVSDNCVMSERTLREAQLLPFQLVVKHARPWAVMTSYNKVNGIHASENPHLLQDILRGEWGWDGLVLSDWWGSYSTSESLRAGMDLEMPGPTLWRGALLKAAVESRKVNMTEVDAAVKNVLNLVKKVIPALTASMYDPAANNTQETRDLVRRLAGESIVLLKNDDSVLPLNPDAHLTYGLIGDRFKDAALCGGGSSEVYPTYKVQPYDALVEVLGIDNIRSANGCNSRNWTPLLWDSLRLPGSGEQGLDIQFFAENPEAVSDSQVLYHTTTKSSMAVFADSLPQPFPETYFAMVRATFTATKSMKWKFGFSVAGQGKLSLNGEVKIDQWDSHPEKKKTDITPCFNCFTMERFITINVQKGDRLDIEILVTNTGLGPVNGIAPAAGVRLGGCEDLNDDEAIEEAVALAKEVDVPIVLGAMGSDWEMEMADRSTLALPGRVDELIERVLDANPRTIIITQSGMPILMPWAAKARTLAHAWLGGQEAGHGITDFLFGKLNPSARLSITFPKRLEDNPAYLTFGKADRNLLYGEGVFVGHRYYEQLATKPEFYFGYGLSYTHFQYSNLVVPATFTPHAENELVISVTIKNIGNFSGAEIVQVYIADPDSSVQRPKKELKAFEKAWLEVGEERTIQLALDKYAISYWSEEYSQWVAESGLFRVILARSADPDDEILRGEFCLREDILWAGL